MKDRFLWHGLMLFWTAIAVISPRFAAGQTQGSAQKDRQRTRPQPEVLRVGNLTPQLKQVLDNWERASKQIKTLQGDHRRFVYDTVFNVEKRADGKFYYESPDKGRIDLKTIRVKAGATSRKLDKTGKPFDLQSDNPERWVCDGEKILQFNDVEKTYETFIIPPDARGQNIMNGPLPFLFGMSAQAAHQRYMLNLLKQDATEVTLHVKPRWKQDAANWREAYVILDTKHFLPKAVKLVDPSGNLETVYTFANFEINKGQGFLGGLFGADPFKPNLRGYQPVQNNPNAQVAQGKKDPHKIPSVIGLDWKVARAVLEAKGYQVQFLRGVKATDPKQIFHVYQQMEVPDKEKTIQLKLYDKSAETELPQDW